MMPGLEMQVGGDGLDVVPWTGRAYFVRSPLTLMR
jgi:hypothetical protein